MNREVRQRERKMSKYVSEQRTVRASNQHRDDTEDAVSCISDGQAQGGDGRHLRDGPLERATPERTRGATKRPSRWTAVQRMTAHTTPARHGQGRLEHKNQWKSEIGTERRPQLTPGLGTREHIELIVPRTARTESDQRERGQRARPPAPEPGQAELSETPHIAAQVKEARRRGRRRLREEEEEEGERETRRRRRPQGGATSRTAEDQPREHTGHPASRPSQISQEGRPRSPPEEGTEGGDKSNGGQYAVGER
ncbi:hypothetical protein ACROYT_G040416 [Oculina patagonica]